ncbi:hypothetical protein [Sphingomonas hylomeconis]|uniref:Transmembrane protein n=1 Tax=Sphingomonas hylomeconis TaxID=1395958 RepID=A0ABV7SQP4_9SPHN|nr:hypothetical protein [Sphingomonas hylomeconis]
MLRGNRGNIIAVIGWLVAIPALWFLITDLTFVSRSYERYASNASNFYRDDAEHEIRDTCRQLAPELEKECIRKAEAAARENQRSEQDLSAQKVTAWWTQIMGGAALIGMALSAIGVALVWTTFRETQRANDINREAMIAGNRAWLKFSVDTDRAWNLQYDAGHLKLTVTALVVNVGATVARDIKVTGSLWLPKYRNGAFDSVPDGVHLRMNNTPTYLFPGDDHAFYATGEIDDLEERLGSTSWASPGQTDLPLLAAVTVSYRLVYEAEEAERRITQQIYVVYRNAQGMSVVPRNLEERGVKLVVAGADPFVT